MATFKKKYFIMPPDLLINYYLLSVRRVSVSLYWQFKSSVIPVPKRNYFTATITTVVWNTPTYLTIFLRFYVNKEHPQKCFKRYFFHLITEIFTTYRSWKLGSRKLSFSSSIENCQVWASSREYLGFGVLWLVLGFLIP